MAQITCSKCAATWPAEYQFCGRCGSTLARPTLDPPTAPPPASGPPLGIPPPPPGPAPAGIPPAPDTGENGQPTVRLVVLRGAVAEGTGVEVTAGTHVIGRTGDLAFPGDPLISARHVVVQRAIDGLDVVEVPGQGGCFRRIREPTTVQPGDVIFAGEQYLLLHNGDEVPFESVAGDDLPPETFGTPLPGPRLHVTQLLAGGLPGRVVSTDRDFITVGREGCDLSFPQDRFMSGRHLRIETAAGGLIQVVDVGSLNGTFVRPTLLPVRLGKSDELLVGSLLFRIDVRDD
jgi:hypothetical protein